MFKNFNIIILLLLSIFTLPIKAEQVEIRYITPPKLENIHLGEKILCHRPMRRLNPNMDVHQIEDKIIANNYGHGGSGWTLGPGSAKHVNDKLLSVGFNELNKDSPITIIGAGALGLFTAYDLYERGYHNLTIIAENFDSLTSHNAGGLLAPVSMDNAPAMQRIIDKIGIDAYKFYYEIATKKHTYFKKGALVVPTYFESKEASGLEPYVGVVMKPAKNVILDFKNGTKRNMVAYDDGIFIDTAEMMATLQDYIKIKNIKLVQQKISSFDEIDSKFIINCTGMGAKDLNKDESMVSVQGHLIMLKNQNPADLQHMILVYFNEDKTESGQKIKRSFYIFPKHLPGTAEKDVGVIGGTFIENATAETPNNREFEILLQGAKRFYGIQK